MSKIVIKSNDSGTGTFTIESPNSNTNRTLSLPDESGSVLSDSSTIDSNNLQSDVYKQDNIVGTVSQSSGVPTGAIIERGSNANGEFVRYADGTQICKTQRYLANPALRDITLPVSFVDGTYNLGIVATTTPFSGDGATTMVTNVYNTSVNVIRCRWAGVSSNETNFTVFGRWF